jgi:hypothetical protein
MNTMKITNLYRLGAAVFGASLALTTIACGDDGGDGGDADAAVVPDADNTPDASGEIAVTEIAGTFVGPESAHWDAANEVWYVSSFGQNLDLTGGTPDEPGYISRVAADGTVLEERFVELDGDFLGMAVMDGVLYVSHTTDLVEVTLADGATNTVAVPGAAFLNDVAVGNGVVYISDTGTNTIFQYTPGGQPEIFTQDAALVAPNGLFVDGDTLIVGTLGAFPPDPATLGGLFQVDAAGVATRLGATEGAFDGIEKIGDQYLVSDFAGIIYLVNADGSVEVVDNFAEDPHNLMSTADIGLDPDTRSVLIPDLVGNAAYLFTLP